MSTFASVGFSLYRPYLAIARQHFNSNSSPSILLIFSSSSSNEPKNVNPFSR